MKYVILYGGTFNPPHVGHLTMAQLALEQEQADEVWFLPAPVPPHKLENGTWGQHNRRKMVEALIFGYDRFRVSDIEDQLPVPSYTVDTVGFVQKQYPDTRFKFLIGSDSLAQLPQWKDAGQLTKRIEFLVAVRQGYPFERTLDAVRKQLPDLNAHAIQMPVLDVSSTWLRDRLTRRLSVCGLVPDRVMDVWSQGKC